VDGREDVLRRIRAGTGGAVAAEVPRAYRVTGSASAAGRERRFVERVEDYGATVLETERPAEAVRDALAAHAARRVGVAADLDGALLPEGIEAVVDDGLTPLELDALDAAVTTCAAACAETGTIALDGGPGQGRRALTLVPDLHVCVVRRADVVETVPELLARLGPGAAEGRAIVLVSGPSATSDIELTRVEGVHGPRRLVVVLVP
jgi:L-lactate dehydrogenase complex protein LldG